MTRNRDPLGSPLSPRELSVLYWMSHGQSNAAIAGRLHITVSTVKNHAAGVLRKLGANDRAHAVRLGFERGLLVSDEAVAL